MRQFYFGVDGTGPDEDGTGTYEAAFQDSFVNTFKREFSWHTPHYRRGPEKEGFQTEPLGADVASKAKVFVRLARAQGVSRSFICLAGYSRGGAAVIHACNLLKEDDIDVDCLLLFDAVDRSSVSGVEVVPSNVARVYHARRHEDAVSRPYFGSCGTSLATGGDGASLYSEKFFYGTHGAIGGVPHDKQTAPVVSLRPVTRGTRFAMMELAMRSMAYFHQSRALSKDQILESGAMPTNVTYEQEKAAAAAVGAWMRSNLTSAKTVWLLDNREKLVYA